MARWQNFGGPWLSFFMFGRAAKAPFSQAGSKIMKRIDVHVQFIGTVTILVPDHLSAADARLLANKLALARILATIDNPDAPEDDACEDYAEECSAKATAEEDWDCCQVQGVGGKWIIKRR